MAKTLTRRSFTKLAAIVGGIAATMSAVPGVALAENENVE